MTRSKTPKSVHTIPASPGFTIWWIDDDSQQTWKGEPVVGWVIEELERQDGSSFYWQYPVTPDDVIGESHTQAYAIECPDGRVIVPQDITYNTIKEFQEILQARPKLTTVKS